MESVEPGRLVTGRYWLGAVIGRGGMGVVWRARDELLGREVAVKELVWPVYFSEAEQQAACRRATTEAQLAARLNHPNVVRIFDIVEEDGCPWIIMELLAYRSLRDLLKEEGPLSPARAAEVGLGIIAALRAAHRAGIVHRDVKPANILMAPDRLRDRAGRRDLGGHRYPRGADGLAVVHVTGAGQGRGVRRGGRPVGAWSLPVRGG